MDNDDVLALIEMLKDWQRKAEADAEKLNEPKHRENRRGEATGLGMAVNALEHFVDA